MPRRWSGEVARDVDGRTLIERVAILSDGTVFRVHHERAIGTVERDADGDWLAKSVRHGNAGLETRMEALVWLVGRDDLSVAEGHGYGVEGTQDEYDEERWFVVDPDGNWRGDSHPTRELAREALASGAFPPPYCTECSHFHSPNDACRCEGGEEQDRYANKSDHEANLERQADVAAANARRGSGPRTPAPAPAGEYRIPIIPRDERGAC
jgi:hypothetical protein